MVPPVCAAESNWKFSLASASFAWKELSIRMFLPGITALVPAQERIFADPYIGLVLHSQIVELFFISRINIDDHWLAVCDLDSVRYLCI